MRVKITDSRGFYMNGRAFLTLTRPNSDHVLSIRLDSEDDKTAIHVAVFPNAQSRDGEAITEGTITPDDPVQLAGVIAGFLGFELEEPSTLLQNIIE